MGFFELFVKYTPLFLEATWVTLRISAAAIAMAMVFGALIAALAMSRLRPLRWLATAYIGLVRGTPLIMSQIRLRTTHGQVAGSGEGYGAEHAFHVALDRLERNVLEMKGMQSDEEYEGQLLRKLNEI